MVKKIIEQAKFDKIHGVIIPEEYTVNVHIVSHEHDDLGYKKTLDQYFSGSQDMIIRAGVQYALDETIVHLVNDPTKKFIYAEMAFFMRWWREQNNEMKNNVHMLVQQGRLQFINGGWSMNDEASTHYEDIITNMQKGHKFLYDNFRVTPNIGWQIDPYGHSSAQAALFSRMGFDAWFAGRIDYRDKIQRRTDKNLEFLWTPFSKDRQLKDSIFTHVTYDMYWGLPNFYFGDLRAEEPIVEGFNSDERLDEFASWIVRLNDTFKTNHIMVPMGGDFSYQNAHQIFMNLDKLIRIFNNRYAGMIAFYSTPGDYIKEVYEDVSQEWDVNEDDFFPYADDHRSYWTGFYSSRANQKGYIRQCSNQLMAANQFLTLNTIRSDNITSLLVQQEKLEEAVSITQHHDAVTGTSRKNVTDDYLDYLHTGLKSSEQAEIESLKKLYGSNIEWIFCDVTNSTYKECPITEVLLKNGKVGVTITNPSSADRINEIVRIKIPPGVNIDIQDAAFKEVDVYSNLVCYQTYTLDGYVDTCDLYILVNSINPFSTKTYILSKREKEPEEIQLNEGYKNISLGYDVSDKTVMNVRFGRCQYTECELHNFSFEYSAYDSYEKEGQKSGVYIMRDAKAQEETEPYNTFTFEQGFMGILVSVITFRGDKIDGQVVINNQADIQTARVITRHKGIDSDHGKEVTVKFIKSSIQNDKFYTDSNGMIMEERVLNQRKHYALTNLTGFEIVSNFYPVNTAVTIRSNEENFFDREQFTVLNDRAQAGTSLNPGEIEFLIHRRTFFDDDRGLAEPLNETLANGKPIIVETIHQVIASKVSDLHNKQYFATKKLQRFMFEEPLQALYFNQKSTEELTLSSFIKKESQFKYTYIGSLPPSIKIVTKPLGTNKIMIRIYNMNEIFDNLNKFVPITIYSIVGDLLEHRVHLYTEISVNIAEWNLSLNRYAGNQRNIAWKIVNGKAKYMGRSSEDTDEATDIIYLENQEMRTFIVEFGKGGFESTE